MNQAVRVVKILLIAVSAMFLNAYWNRALVTSNNVNNNKAIGSTSLKHGVQPDNIDDIPHQTIRKEFEIDASICLRDSCVQDKARELARLWPDNSNRSWAVHYQLPVEDRLKRGLLMVKVPKTASTTSATVALRLAKKYGDIPVLYHHGIPSTLHYKYRHYPQSYLFSSIRQPQKRALSFLWYHFSRLQQTWNETTILQQLQDFDSRIQDGADTYSRGRGGFQLRYLTLKEIPPHSAYSSETPDQVLKPTQVASLAITPNVQDVINQYDFLLVVERMEESLVAMSFRMGITLGDILVSSAKVAGQSYMPAGAPPKCIALKSPPKKLPASVAAFFASDVWRAMNYGDYLLHATANASLDKTISDIGQEIFQRALAEYQQLKSKAYKVCADAIHLPCSSNGTMQLNKSAESCYTRDFGCGYHCFDKFLAGQR